MNISNKSRAAGIAAGIAIFVAAFLFSTIAATKSPSEKAPAPAVITESVVAPAEQLGKAFAAVAAHIKPAVVSVYSEKMVKVQPQEFPFDFPFGDDFFNQFFGQQSPHPGLRNKPKEYRVPQSGMGSGMILDKQGHILTNYHVVSGVDKIKVKLADKRSFEAKIVGTDPKTDVAIIRITGDVPDDLPTVQLGDSDALEVGHLVMAVGAPFGLTQTVTSGIISAKGRSDVGIAAYEDFLQTDAPINPGNSGGPLVNMRGEVIGMNSAIATGGAQFGGGQSAGVGFAIPSNMIKAMLPTLIKGGKITRGMLGVVIQDINKELADQFHLPDTNGALVSQVNKDSPAERAGLKAGDVIVRLDGKEVRDTRQLRNLVAATAPGSNVKIGVIRDGKERTFSATIGKMTAESAAAPKLSGKAADQLTKLGLSVQTLTPELAKQSGLQGERGVLISGVDPGSPAAMANLQTGDLIVEANRVPITNIGELQNALRKSPDQILFLVKRNGASLFVVIQLK
jgi:serine protease Do